MAGSEAEERIRAKTVDRLRHLYPTARIIHELVLNQGTERLDLAAVTPDQLILVEIKSERDTLKRLAGQLRASLEVANATWIVVAEKHAAALEDMGEYHRRGPPQPRTPPLTGTWRELTLNPDYNGQINLAHRFVEREAGLDRIGDPPYRSPLVDTRALFNIMWAEERRAALAAVGAPVTSKATCEEARRWAVENMTGAQIRRAVCRALLGRTFARADRPQSLDHNQGRAA